MSYRNFSFPAFALPGLDVPIAEPGPDGKLYPTEDFRRWMEGVNFVRGGDGRDAIYDIDGDVADAVSDGVLTPAEKLSVIPLISAVQAAETDLVDAAAKVGVSSTAYEAAQDAFAALLATLTSPTAWNSSTGKTTIPDPADFKTKWQAVLDEEAALRAALDDDIANAVVDGTLTIAEKRIIVPQIKALQAEEASLVSAAANRNESSTAYEGKQDDLVTYLATLTSPVAWDNFTGTTTIAAPGTFNTRVQDVIEARDALRSAIEAADIRAGNILTNDLGGVVSGFAPSHDWTTAAATSTWVESDFDALSVQTAELDLEPGEAVRIRISYKIRCVKDAFEHFTYRDRITLQGRAGGNPWFNLTVFDYSENKFSTTANTGAIDGTYGTTQNVTQREFDEVTYESSPLATFDRVRARVDIEPWNAGRASGACAVGSINGTKIRDELELADVTIVMEHVKSGPFQVG